MTEIKMELGERSYPIYVGRGLLDSADKYFNLDRRVLIVTDSGVPKEYAERVSALCKSALTVTVKEGEGSKSPETFIWLCEKMLQHEMTRSDAVVAVGGGVVGDLAGFAAASYMRGIDFYNIPTTLLSEVDSSIGGKVGINLGSVKNIVGAFHQPKAVIIDPDTLKTLPERLIAEGAAEALKMAITSSPELFELLSREGVTDGNVEEVITLSLGIKKRVVELDEREGGLRKILNFGHTFGHGIEASCDGRYYHGECVALGMLCTVDDSLRERMAPVYEKLGLPLVFEGDLEEAIALTAHDKKREGERLSVILCDDVGKYRIEKMSRTGFKSMVNRAVGICARRYGEKK